MQSLILAAALALQTPAPVNPPAPPVPPVVAPVDNSVPTIKLDVPQHPVGFARSVRMKVELPPKGPAPNDWETYSVEWDVTELSQSDNPLENDLDVDSNTLKASIPSGLVNTKLKVKVVITFFYTDAKGVTSSRVARDTQYVTIQGVQPQPGPTPGPGPVNPPVPGPAPVVPPVVIPAEQYGLITWSKAQLSKSALPKDQAKALATAFHGVSSAAKSGAYQTKDATVSAMAAKNREVLGTNLSAWVDGYLKPLQAQLNPMNPKIKTVADQATIFDEIGYGLDAYAGS